jgi:hypothetical protein
MVMMILLPLLLLLMMMMILLLIILLLMILLLMILLLLSSVLLWSSSRPLLGTGMSQRQRRRWNKRKASVPMGPPIVEEITEIFFINFVGVENVKKADTQQGLKQKLPAATLITSRHLDTFLQHTNTLTSCLPRALNVVAERNTAMLAGRGAVVADVTAADAAVAARHASSRAARSVFSSTTPSPLPPPRPTPPPPAAAATCWATRGESQGSALTQATTPVAAKVGSTAARAFPAAASTHRIRRAPRALASSEPKEEKEGGGGLPEEGLPPPLLRFLLCC